jgi:nucleotide-binding universal stress UspA family protein
MKRILLPTDFSANALNAIKYALYILENEECVFYLLNAYQVSPSALTSRINQERQTRLFEITEEESLTKMEKLMALLAHSNPNSKHTFKTFCKPGDIIQIIYHFVNEFTIDFIFMGTKGSTAAKEIFMGSTTVAVIKNIDYCAVIAVPKKYCYDLPDEILFATDFKRFFEDSEIKPLKQIASLWRTKIRILYVNEAKLNEIQLNNRQILYDLLKEVTLLEEDTVKHKGSIAKTIMKYSRKKKIEMVAMVNNKHSFAEKLFREAVIKKVMFKTNIPFLVMPEREE